MLATPAPASNGAARPIHWNPTLRWSALPSYRGGE